MSASDETQLCRLVYRSRSLLTGSDLRVEGAMEEIVGRSNSNNARAGVTGALLAVGDVFVQVLEGPQAAVEGVFERICCDRRHTEVQVVDICEASARSFADWGMKRIVSSTGAEVLFARFGEFEGGLGPAPAAAEDAVSLMATLVRLETSSGREPHPAPCPEAAPAVQAGACRPPVTAVSD